MEIKDPKEYFYIMNGEVLKDLHELLDSLKKIDDASFLHHVNDAKNDFAEWISQCIKETGLADEIRKLKSKDEIISKIEMHLGQQKKKVFSIAKHVKEAASKSKATLKSSAKRIVHIHKKGYDLVVGRLSCNIAKMFSSMCQEGKHECKRTKS